MRAKLVVFPIRGRNWCFTRAIDHSVCATPVFSQSPSTLKDLWKNVATKPVNIKAELCVDFIANKVTFFFFSRKFLFLGYIVFNI